MIPQEEVESNIRDMGYVTVTPRVIYPSYYKLSDGTIIKALVSVNYLVPNPRAPDGFAVNSINLVAAFVPKEKRRPEAFQPYSQDELQSGIIDDDMDVEVMRENFSVYDLSNGMVLSVKTVVGQIRKTKFFNQDGEPVYLINANPIMKVKKP